MSAEKRNLWGGEKTCHGLPTDQVLSALQKEIRRNNTENAVLLAYEMMITSPAMEAHLWRRLMIISVEDIGFGEPNAPVMLSTLYQMVKTFDWADDERALFTVHAVRYLCGCRKDRSSDEMVAWIKHAVSRGEAEVNIPDYALDMHTAEGRAKGRGLEHFYKEGAKVVPELPNRDVTYRQRILEMLET
ncbi:hypothetical protein [Desulfonema magnum]|uniref:AAA ATPase-like domain-containing protein n=1 Tax=Desulfonema magnum TaxID=45655 RepID=A0A975GT96_9BACT|nr:hypothetical protein [Desulfonema magnum]QTA92757.1 AAA ATPase-like domain-containing protein [Desulfonema magnum]